MNQAITQMPSLRDRIVEVLREHSEVKHIGALADKLEAALNTPPEQKPGDHVWVKCPNGHGEVTHQHFDYCGVCPTCNDVMKECDPPRSVALSAPPIESIDEVFSTNKTIALVSAPPPPLLGFEIDGKVAKIDIFNGELHFSGDLPVSDAAKEFFKFLLGHLGDELISRSAPSAQVQDVAKWEPPQDCERKEELAFETWASSQHYDMHEHPLHYLFLDPKTDAARQGWKAALQYVRDDFAAAPARQNGCRHDLGSLEIHLQKLIEADPYKASMASNNEDLRLWFVAELISKASGRIPLLEIEGLVSRQLAAVEGGEA
ncbi:hypothetical protein G6M85_22595 [Agrobacterium tumefaciens]|uniref:hypothetical protein n=1 Tax=Agrobacterium tumefaciens TaxID=358 RepID=UPI0015738D16|nr:hypothetical protein [Agrobacterium tumefaciens]NTE68387.1 hypothetical protein [Agrobacterium tumefaciens]